ncbi:MAG TPA: VIT family protein [Solirubrobacteraceae bacterium]|nr:VIT family protein [Solirubrobacteraceae bacterium]
MSLHSETHLSYRSGWLRAAVLGANDGILSVASVALGVAASGASQSVVATAGIAALSAGAMSMAAGEFVSVSSQRDTEQADLAMEARELATNPGAELAELTAIYVERGLGAELARDVAVALTAHDALGAHARDELGLDDDRRARPVQAAAASAAAFSAGAILPLIAVIVPGRALRIPVCLLVAVIVLVLLGDLGARLGGAPRLPAVARVTGWGLAAMGVTAGIGALTGSVTG